MASFIAMANVADETVDSKPRYRLGGMHLLDGSFENFVRRWEQETGGKLAKIGGQYKVWLPHDDLVPLTVITQDKLANGPVQHTIAGDIRAITTARVAATSSRTRDTEASRIPRSRKPRRSTTTAGSASSTRTSAGFRT